MTYKSKPVVSIQGASNGKLRNCCIKIVAKRSFDNLIMLCIVLNTLVLALKWFNQADTTELFLISLNFVFNVVFTIEAIIKIVALRSSYFKDSWNNFDFLTLLVTYVFFILVYMEVYEKLG